MWTPKRVLLVVLGLGLFVGCYAAYARHLGMIDGLPPLPELYWPDTDRDPEPLPVRPQAAVVRKLETAFGRKCPEIDRPIKIEVPARGIVLSAKDFFIESDGRVRLQPLSIAIFGRTRGEDGTPEINTVRSAIAHLTFERPIVNIADMGKHRITAAQIAGDIRIVNNRRTLARDDDLLVDISKGPLFYDQKLQKVWTEDAVHLEDLQSKPRPTQISGQGLVMELLADQLNGNGKDRQPRQRTKQVDAISGVRTVLLERAVDMHLFVDGKSGFLSSGAAKDGDRAAPADPKKAPEKAHLIIKTHGPFRYDMEKDFATFDIPPARPGQASPFPEHVVATRVHDALGKLDQLVCERLELQFRKKESPENQAKPGEAPTPPAPAKKDDPGPDRNLNLQIETAHAIGKSVILVSDAELLEAHGNDFFYDARTSTSTLKGKPMWAVKEGNEIQAQQLEIVNLKTGQSARALGPGILTLFDKASGKRSMKARWTQMLVSTRDGDYDLLHLTGKAAFVDEENNQELHADDLRVWLLPQEPAGAKKAPPAKPAPAAEAKGSPQRSRRPHHLIATGHVRSVSKEFNIRSAQRFVVWFTEAPPGTVLAGSGKGQPAKPGAAPAPGTAPVPGSAPAPGTPPAPAAGPMGQPGKPGEPGKPAAAPEKKEERKPIDLWARSVEAHVLRAGDKSQLQRMRSEGSVHVVQAPAKPGEKGVDIKGDTLNLTAHPEGNYLVVTGDLARLDMDKMLILGPEVNIDQVANKAWVNGIGAMTVESESDFQGNKLKKPTPLTIHWNKAMVFSGQLAVFHGGIQADQENARLTCQELQVFFDRPISLREGQKDRDRAKVRNLTCDQSARVEDSVIENGKEIKYQQLIGRAIAYDNEEGTVEASGPGELRLMQKGDSDPLEGPGPQNGERKAPATKPADRKDEEMKLTYVHFHARMNGYKKKNMAVFFTNVRVLHMPGDNPRADIDLDRVITKLPAGAMFLRCDMLKVFTRPNPRGGKAWQEMRAQGRVQVFSPEFSGQADRVTYDEEKDQVLFDGGEGGTATLWKQRVPGERAQKIEGRTIIYERRTGKHTGTDIQVIIGQ